MSRPTLLVLRALGLGDLLTAVPALRALAEAFPGHERVLAGPAALEPLALLTGAVDRVVPALPLGPLSWCGAPPDVAVNLHGRGPESHAVLRALEPRRTIAFAHPAAPGSEAGPQWRREEHEVARWCRLLVESGIVADPTRLDLVEAPSGCARATSGCAEATSGAEKATSGRPGATSGAEKGAAGRARPTLLHPGAASPARRWPAERWAAVARAETRAGRAVVITGAPEEAALAREVARAAGLGDEVVLAGRTSVLELVAVVAGAARVVVGDTGVAHLATALRRPSVVLFGPTPPDWWGPPADRPWHRALWAGELGEPNAPWPHHGLLRLTVDDVLAALADLPAAPPGLAKADPAKGTPVLAAKAARADLSATPAATAAPTAPTATPEARR